ncbi:hypothetical protein CBR_g68768 [Chara braunii]|uniref:HAT C-terminal dimerisation domain-containing protein n=1 Tax=Chara braunii TaxID=69332 RepID=A0A388K9N9_CHABU|nr:hypothetical protein CBR_g68768 [Chara braunii]|eukprot:GBG66782.1 hypothetical protein CBR_g68768 [Chara braunii]
MDRNDTAPPTLWHFDEGLGKRLKTLTRLTDDQRQGIMRAVDQRTKMMRQHVYAANVLLVPRRRDNKWLMDLHSPLVPNNPKFFLSQCKEEATWGCKEQLDLWADLQAFHKEPTKDILVKDSITGKVVEESLWIDFAKFDSSVAQMTTSEWWNLHGVSHKKLRDIAVRVTTMWSTANPCERNGSSLDLVHDKRRALLLPDSLTKLVHIHWNLQLLDITKKKSTGSLAGYLDMWVAFFNDVEAPTPNDSAVLPKAATPTHLRWVCYEEVIVKSRDGYDLPAPSALKAKMGVEDEEKDIEESEKDDENFTLRFPRASDMSNNDNDLARDDYLMHNVERDDLDSGLEFVRPRGMDFNACVKVDKDFDDNAKRARAQSLAYRDRALNDGLQWQQEQQQQQQGLEQQQQQQEGLHPQQQQYEDGVQQQQQQEKNGPAQHQQQENNGPQKQREHNPLQQKEKENGSATGVRRVYIRRPPVPGAAAVPGVDVSLVGRKKKVQPETGLKVARKRGRPRKYPLQPAASTCAPTGEDGGEGGEVEEHVARVRKVQGGPALTVDCGDTPVEPTEKEGGEEGEGRGR